MREIEMRQRIEGFLKRRMQLMLAPVLGLGMAVTGCQTGVSLYMGPMPDANPSHTAGASDSAPSFGDAAPADILISADVAVAGSDAAPDQPSPPDASARQDLAMQDLATTDASPELDGGMDAKPDSIADTPAEAGARVDAVGDTGLIAKYMAPLPDGGPSDTGLSDTGPRDTGMIAKYMAPLLDGSPTPAPDYMAQMPDAAEDLSFGVRYMAQIPG